MSDKDDRLRTVAWERFGWPRLRAGQERAMAAVLAGRDTLAVMPTGHGKSAIYQVPAALLDGPTLVVSPLISLQHDQVAGLEEAPDAPDAVAVNSAQRQQETRDAWQAVEHGEAEYLFLSPEQLADADVLRRVQALGVSLVVVDEAHCVSSWGHDFRPDYQRLGGVIEQLGHPTVVALTATASPPVREEVAERLGMVDPLVVVSGFDRPNITLQVVRHTDDTAKRRKVVEQVAGLDGPGLLYVATRKDTEHYADALVERGVRAAAYHAGRRAADRRAVQEAFDDDALDVVVATSAFGMGIDKPNVRFVVHADVPDSIDSYYQEVGRAGRDGEHAVAVLHYRPEDLGLRRFFSARRPDEVALRALVETLRDERRPLRATRVAERMDVSTRRVTGLANLLEQAGAVGVSRAGLAVYAGVDVDEAVAQAVEAAETRERVERSRVEMMRGYAETTACRRQFLLGYFGEELDGSCGRCDTCAEAPEPHADDGRVPVRASDQGTRAASRFPLQSRVQHVDWGPGVVMRHEDDRITVLFEQEGYKTLALELVEDQDLLLPQP